MPEVTISVAGMTCQHCAGRVVDAASAVAGITQTVVDLEAGRVTMQAADTDALAAVKDAITAAGYEVPRDG